MRWLMIASFGFLGVLSWAEIVELKTGERVSGKLKQVTESGVLVDVGGQPITFSKDKIRAIYFEEPTTTQRPAGLAGDAVDALVGLQSITESGLNYSQYSTRVLDARVRVDRYLTAPANNDFGLKRVIREAMRYYELGSRAWSAKIANNLPALTEVGVALKTEQCPALLNVANSALNSNPSSVGLAAGEKPDAFWVCAKPRVAEARRLLQARN